MIIADSNVVSELMKDQPDPAVLSWAEELDSSQVTISVVTVEEIERGLCRLPAGRRRRTLTDRWRRLLQAYADTALARECQLATRNVHDFTDIPHLRVIDPFR